MKQVTYGVRLGNNKHIENEVYTFCRSGAVSWDHTTTEDADDVLSAYGLACGNPKRDSVSEVMVIDIELQN